MIIFPNTPELLNQSSQIGRIFSQHAPLLEIFLRPHLNFPSDPTAYPFKSLTQTNLTASGTCSNWEKRSTKTVCIIKYLLGKSYTSATKSYNHLFPLEIIARLLLCFNLKNFNLENSGIRLLLRENEI